MDRNIIFKNFYTKAIEKISEQDNKKNYAIPF